MRNLRLLLAAGMFLLGVYGNTALAQGNFYAFGALGNANSDISLGAVNRVDDDRSAFSLGVGYALTDILSLEAAYQDFGTLDGETDCPPGFTCLVIPVVTRADLTGLTLSLVGNVALSERLEAYGKAGIASWDLHFKGISSAFDDSGEDLVYGVGLRASLNDDWKVFLDYSRIQLDANTASVGVSYQF